MIRFLSIILIAFASLHALSIDPLVKESVNTSMEQFVAGNFDLGFKQLDSLEIRFPKDPLPAMVRVWGIGLRDMDYDRPTDSATFLPAFRNAVARIDIKEKTDGQTSYVLTMRGFCQATYASWCMRMKKYSDGIGAGFNALDRLKEAKKKDSTNIDVNFFLGLYDCAKNEMSRRLSFVTFWYPSATGRGIAMLFECANGAQFASLGALMVLPDVLSNAGRYAETDSVLGVVSHRFPQSRFVYWSKIKTFTLRKDYPQAIAAAHALSVLYAPLADARRSHAAVLLELVRLNALASNQPMAKAISTKMIALYGHEQDSYFKEMCATATKLAK